MMEINEAIMDAKMEGASLPSQVFEGIAEQEKVLDSDLNKLMKSFDLTQNKILLTDIEEAWLKKKYILRIKDSLDTFANP
jgi:molecular chaperone HscB